MICKSCGAKFSDGTFCPECGKAMASAPSKQMGSWEDALGYSEDVGYNMEMYGPQGRLEEQHITREIKIDAGKKRVFENKMLIFGDGIKAEDSTKLEFRNCTIVLGDETAIRAWGSNIHMSFENCFIKGDGKLVDSWIMDYENFCAELEFRNCAFVGNEGMSEQSYPLITLYGNTYFENCFMKEQHIARFDGGRPFLSKQPKAEFRKCVIISEVRDAEEAKTPCIEVEGDNAITVDFDNCYIRSSKKLVGSLYGVVSGWAQIKLNIKNSYLEDYSYVISN